MYALAAQSTVRAQAVDTANTANDTTAFHMTKSPLKAVLLSAIIPGAGQVYLDQAWKVPIIWGIAGGFLYGALIQNYRYHYTADSVNNQLARGDTALSLIYTNVREFYRDDRDKWWIYVALTYIANLLDAYIAANLYDFDVSNPSPSPIGTYYDPLAHQWGVNFQLKF
jgi:TM2 domain-containing membrane protein YozV